MNGQSCRLDYQMPAPNSQGQTLKPFLGKMLFCTLMTSWCIVSMWRNTLLTSNLSLRFMRGRSCMGPLISVISLLVRLCSQALLCLVMRFEWMIRRLRAIIKWPNPTSIPQARSFHSLTSFYRRLVYNFNNIMFPISELTKTKTFQLSDKAQATFETIRYMLTTSPILALPNFQETFEVECDASRHRCITFSKSLTHCLLQ